MIEKIADSTSDSYKPLRKNKTFSFILSGYTLSIFGDCFHSIALNIWILQNTGSAKLMSAVMITSMVMSLIFGSVAGTIADRVDRRKLMWITDLISGVLVLGVAFTMILPNISFMVLLLLTALNSFVRLFQYPALQSSLTDIVGKANIQKATGAMGVADNIARISGLAIGGVAVATFGGAAAVIFNGISYFLCAILIWLGGTFPTSRNFSVEKKTFKEDFVSGLIFIWKNRFTRAVMILSPLLGMFFVSFLMLTQVAAVKVWKATPMEFGLLEACIPAGYLAGAGIIMYLGKRVKRRGFWIIGSMVLMAPLFMIISVLKSSTIAIPIIFIIGILFAFSTFLMQVIMREEVESDLQGRLFGILGSISSVAPPIALALFSFFTDLYGSSSMLLVNGLLLLLAGILSSLFLKAIIRV